MATQKAPKHWIGGAPSDIISFKTFKGRPELMVLAGCIGFAATMGLSYMTYSVLTKSDVNLNRTARPRHETLDPYTYRFKLMTHKQKHLPDEERDALLKEIGSYRA